MTLDRPISSSEVVAMAAANARGLTHEALVAWLDHPRATIRRIASTELNRRRRLAVTVTEADTAVGRGACVECGALLGNYHTTGCSRLA